MSNHKISDEDETEDQKYQAFNIEANHSSQDKSV